VSQGSNEDSKIIVQDAWYYANQNEQVGPVSLEELRQALSTFSTANTSEVLVWHQGFSGWKPAKEVAELNVQTPLPPPLPTSFMKPPPPPLPSSVMNDRQNLRRVPTSIKVILGLFGVSVILLFALPSKPPNPKSNLDVEQKVEHTTATPSTVGQSGLPPCPSDIKAHWANCEGTLDWGDRKIVGEFKEDGKMKQGTITWADGRKYVGELLDSRHYDVMNGQGTLTWPDGGQYVGEFKDGKENGQGTFTFPSGRKFQGEFRNGETNRQGTLFDADGSIVASGIWENNELVSSTKQETAYDRFARSQQAKPVEPTIEQTTNALVGVVRANGYTCNTVMGNASRSAFSFSESYTLFCDGRYLYEIKDKGGRWIVTVK
jgi:hypothetical protein